MKKYKLPKLPEGAKPVEGHQILNSILHAGVCPTCKTHLESAYNKRYCGSCGQPLDWRASE